MAIKKHNRGKVIGTLSHFTIRHMPEFEGYGKKRKEKTSTIGIFKGKVLVEKGFKNCQEALGYASELLK